MPDPATKIPISAVDAKAKILDFKPKHNEFHGAITGIHLHKIDTHLTGQQLPYWSN
jgi:hypothetical protein